MLASSPYCAKHIVQYWDHPTVPELLAERMRGWRELNPDWEYRCFDRHRASLYMGQMFGTAVCEAFLDLRFPAMQADVFRVAYLLQHGGLWVDAATLCREPLATWLDASQPLVLLRKPQQQPPMVWNGLIYARDAGHPFLQVLWCTIHDVILNRIGRGIWKLVGPGLYRDLLADADLAGTVAVVPVVTIADKLQVGCSSLAMPKEQHWSLRQKQESLYFSVPFPNAHSNAH